MNEFSDEVMEEQILYDLYQLLSDNKKMDYLYTYLVEGNTKKLFKKYGPKRVEVTMLYDKVILKVNRLKDARAIKHNMFFDGTLLLNEKYDKTNGGYIVTYDCIGQENAICLT